MKFVMIAAIALVFLGGGAAGAYFFLNKPAVASATEMSEAEKADAAAAKAAHEAALEAVFVKLDPLILPIVDSNGVTQTVSIVISIEVADEEAAARVEAMQPRLKDAFLQDMYGMLSQKAVMKGGVIEVAKIKARLNNISHKVMGGDTVKEVLLQVVQQRRI